MNDLGGCPYSTVKNAVFLGKKYFHVSMVTVWVTMETWKYFSQENQLNNVALIHIDSAIPDFLCPFMND